MFATHPVGLDKSQARQNGPVQICSDNLQRQQK